jgi:hypothetical protein
MAAEQRRRSWGPPSVGLSPLSLVLEFSRELATLSPTLARSQTEAAEARYVADYFAPSRQRAAELDPVAACALGDAQADALFSQSVFFPVLWAVV